MSIKSFKLENIAARVLVLILGIICVALTYFFVKWFFASTIAGQAVSLKEKNREVADLALSLAPADPRAHLVSAVIYDKTFLIDDLPKSLAEYERAVALSPFDYRLWHELGRARERSGETDGAEASLRKALELAPHYAQIQWTLGNFLLRQGKTEEAFQKIRQAAESEKNFANPAIAGAWQLFGGDVSQMKRFAGDSPNLKSALAALLAKEKRFDEALEMWNSLPAEARQNEFKANGEEIYQKMLEAKKYRDALQLFTNLKESGAENPSIGKIANGGFELETPKNASVYEWQIAEGVEPQIGKDNTQRHGGSLSLVLIFNNPDGKAFRSVSQTVAVESGKKYVFEVFSRADLKTSSTLRWEIVDAGDGKVLAATEPAAAKTDWTSLKTEFVAPETTEGVTIRLARAACPSSICPIAGKIWFDDFSLNAQ